MAQQLIGLIAAFWKSGDFDAARVLADRAQELPAEDVAQALVEFRVGVLAFDALSEVGEAINGTDTVAACRAFAEALRRLPPGKIARALQALPESDDPNFPP